MRFYVLYYSRFVLRYKMICKETWPNPRGSDRDGTQAILKSQKLDGDVTYGKTKIFIKSPETVFQLEEVRYSSRCCIISVSSLSTMFKV